MKDNVVKEKTLKYAVKAVMLSKELVRVHNEYILSRQFVKSSTSIGAQVSEAEYAQSKADFINKMSIGLKEANESSVKIKRSYQNYIALPYLKFDLLKYIYYDKRKNNSPS